MSRLDPPATESMTDAQQQVHDAITAGPRGAVRGPLGVWLWQPALAQNAQALGQYCRYDSSLPPRLSELAILLTARHWGSEFEWQHHRPIAEEAGLSVDLIEAIRLGKTPASDQPDEQAVIAVTTELLNTRQVSEGAYQNAISVLGRESMVDLVGVLGYYSLISMTINVFEVDPPDAPVLS